MFDQVKADHAVKFIECLKLTADFHGQPFALMDWQRAIISDVFGTINERGIRQYRYVYIECPKKNAKSQLSSGIALLQLFNKAEPNGQIVICAGDREQASETIYDPLIEMIEQEPALIKRVKITDSQKIIENKETGTMLKVVSAEAYTKHGWNISLCVFDELHVQPNRSLYDTMMKGSGLARRQPMWVFITTSGNDPDRTSIAWEVHEKAEKIIRARDVGNADNDIPTWYPKIFAYNGEEIYNEANWKLANPSLGVTLQIEDLRDLAREAKQHPADEMLFRWLNLCQWPTTKLSNWLPLDLFDATVGTWSRSDLFGKTCFMGGDFSTTTDLSATALVFPPQDGLEDWRVIWDCWIPLENMLERIRLDRVPYDQWAAAGWITPTEGNSIDYLAIRERIKESRQLYNVVELDCDTSFATMLLQELEQDGMTCVAIPQQYATLTDPMNLLEVLLRQRRADGLPVLTHENHPVARWCFGNTSVSKNGNAQIKYVKEHRGRSVDRTKRIDLTAAWVCAMARAKEFNKIKSVYESRGLRTI
jgi:phage terminase large subunit-like protein